jgi:hypothetical protein
MPKSDEKQDENLIGGMKVQTENISFRSDEMITCAKCDKSNPPNRASCLYCGSAIETPVDALTVVKLNLRKLENWENGFNIVLISHGDDADAESAARYLRYDVDLFKQMLAAKSPFPLARLESASEASIAGNQLAAFGLLTKIVNDVELKIGKPNIRLRSVGFFDGSVRLTAFNTNEQRSISSDEIVLIVVGRIVESKMESVEKGKKDRRKVLAETATSSDELLIDIYTAETERGWRVTTKGFDFSTLGNEKRLLAVENIQLILEKLKSFASTAKVVDEYPALINPLSEVWDIERRKDFEGLKRTGVWKAGFSSVARTSNLEQFTKYSRLQRILL